MTIIRLIYAFTMGILEHRSDFTMAFRGQYLDAYDRGRYLAWNVTGWNDEDWQESF
jgi:hypothetical protein